MKKLILTILLLNLNLSFAANIKYLDPNEVEDLDYCSRLLLDMSYDEVDERPNHSYLLDRDGELSHKLMHNFIYDMYYYDSYFIDGSVITSATLRYTRSAKIINSVISNMTFVGDVSGIDFSGSCLVNVRFPKETSWSVKRKIRREAIYYKNIEFKDESAD